MHLQQHHYYYSPLFIRIFCECTYLSLFGITYSGHIRMASATETSPLLARAPQSPAPELDAEAGSSSPDAPPIEDFSRLIKTIRIVMVFIVFAEIVLLIATQVVNNAAPFTFGRRPSDTIDTLAFGVSLFSFIAFQNTPCAHVLFRHLSFSSCQLSI
jgi:hypothetical protein